jgi:hypothetical protein
MGTPVFSGSQKEGALCADQRQKGLPLVLKPKNFFYSFGTIGSRALLLVS